MNNLWNRWNHFWFSPVPLLNLALFRVIFGAVMTIMYLNRQKDVALFYTDQGVLPRNLSLQILPELMRPTFQLMFWPDSWMSSVHALFVILLLALTLGVGGRMVALAALYLQLAFLFRNYGVAFGADQIGTIFLLYLAMTRSDQRLSLKSWWRSRRGWFQEAPSDLLTSVFYRMIQIQLCVIYVYSGMEKLKGATWWDGTAVWSVLANSQMVIADLTWVRHFPLIIVLASFSTILFEIYFPVLVWFERFRKFLLTFGFFFHLGIGVLMALWSFAILMVSSYVLFLPESLTEKWVSALRLRMRQLKP